MDSPSYINLENFYFVPVLRFRLAFAELVRRTVWDLDKETTWSKEDLIAVSLPPSVGRETQNYLQSNAGEPLDVSLLFASWDGEDVREAFAISPCDGLIEAIRLALELHLDVAFIDKEIAPGNLLRKRCMDDPEWPDDALVLDPAVGSAGYLRLIRRACSQPPIRFEPVDTWRETHMAQELRRLRLRYRRIMVVCESHNYFALVRLLSNAETVPFEDAALRERARRLGFIKSRASMRVILQYLDDYPKVCEEYERQRSGTHERAAFDKRGHLLKLVREIAYETEDERPSPRRMEIFGRYLSRLTKANRRIVPRPAELFEACAGCFGQQTAEKVIHRLGEYAEQIRLEKVRPSFKGTQPAVYRLRQRSVDPKFTARSCSPQPQEYVVDELPRIQQDGRGRQGTVILRDIWIDVRRKAAQLAKAKDRRSKSSEFRGSLEAGVDARRSLRASIQFPPKIYVQRYVRQVLDRDFLREPMVWVLQPVLSHAFSSIYLMCASRVLSGVTTPAQSRAIDGVERELFQASDHSLRVVQERTYGFLDLLHLADGEQLKPPPGARVLDHTTEFNVLPDAGCILKEFNNLADHQTPWWDILILTGLAVASRAIVCILPEGFRLSPLVRSRAGKMNKQIVTLHLSSFTLVQRQQLAMNYKVEHPGKFDEPKTKENIKSVLSKLGIV